MPFHELRRMIVAISDQSIQHIICMLKYATIKAGFSFSPIFCVLLIGRWFCNEDNQFQI